MVAKAGGTRYPVPLQLPTTGPCSGSGLASRHMTNPLPIGERVPDITLPTPSNPRFHFETVAGREIVLAFLGPAADAGARALVEEARSVRALFDDVFASLFLVVRSPEHARALGVTQEVPGIRYFIDAAGVAARDYSPDSFRLKGRGA